MSNEEEFEALLEKMRRDWDERATKDAQHYVYTRDWSTDESDFEASGRVNYDQLVRPFLPVLLCGRSPKSCRVVEIGCGVGRITRSFAEEFREVHGVDISAEMIERARVLLRDYPNTFLHVGSGMDLGCLPEKYFDLAFSYLVFQHIPSRAVIENYVKEAARVLKPGGAFKFQLNGYQAIDYRQREKDTWLGESFSFAEAAQMLTQAGFYPLAATGAGTQYFILTARRMEEEGSLLSPYILPGQGWARGQLLEGWQGPISGDCWPVGPRCRTLLAVPPGPMWRVFLSLYFALIEPLPAVTLTVSVNEFVLGSARIDRKGDHYFEWPIPPSAVSGSRALLTLEFHTLAESVVPSVRCLGIYTPGESAEAREARTAWTRELGTQPEEDHRLLEAFRRELEDRVSWSLERERLTSMASEFQANSEEKVAWAQRLDAELEEARQILANLQREFEERTAWAQKLDAELEAVRADLRLIFGSLWYRLGKNLRLSPVPRSDRGRRGRP